MNLTETQQNNLKKAAEKAREYLYCLSQDTTNFEVYLVGGAVRDALLNEPVNDLDFVITNETNESMQERGFENIDASSYDVFHDDEHNEFALARTETKAKGEFGYKSIKTDTEGTTISEDLARRDLTINAMAIKIFGERPTDIEKQNTKELTLAQGSVIFIDRFNGVEHLNEGTIKHINNKFREDPLRVMRAARYTARFEKENGDPFTLHPDTQDLMRMVAPELNRMSRPRLGEEVIKAMKQAKNPDEFWNTLRDTGALATIAPKLDRGMIVPSGKDKYHSEGNVYEHTMFVLREMHDHCEENNITGMDRVRRYMMAVAHDVGKVTSGDDQGGLWSDDPPTGFPGHAKIGRKDAESMGESLGLPTHVIKAMMDGCEHHMHIHDLPVWQDKIKTITFIEDHTPQQYEETPFKATVEELIDLAKADHQGRFQEINVFDTLAEYQEHEDAPVGTAQPVFDQEPYLKTVSRAREVINEVDGYHILKKGLCNECSEDNIDNDDLAERLSTCEDCRTPGEWVGEELNKERRNQMVN